MAIGGELTKRDTLLVGVVVIFIALAVAYWYFPYAEKKRALGDLDGRVQMLERRNREAMADLAAGGPAQLAEEVAMYTSMFDVLRRLVPEVNEVPTLLEAMSTASRRAGLELGEITPLPVIEGPEFDTHRYRVGVVGGYHAIARFLTNVGSLTRIVTSVDLKLIDRESVGSTTIARPSDAALVQAEFEMRTFVARKAPLAGTAVVR
jgi:type IV pilus assembly protein PilO